MGGDGSASGGPPYHPFTHSHLDAHEEAASYAVVIGVIVLCLVVSFTCPKFWVNQGLFLATGIPMVLLMQDVTNLGGNNPLAFLGAVSTYGGLVIGGGGAILLGRVFRGRDAGTLQSEKGVTRDAYGNEVFRNGSCFWIVLPIALADFSDKYFMAWALTYAGSGLYIVIFSSLTVFTALIRRCFLKRKLLPVQWLAIVVINIGLGLTSLNAEFGHFSWTIAGGIAASLTCALTDAIFYVLCERALTQVPEDKRPSENDICTVHGLIGGTLTAVYLFVYWQAGKWETWVDDYRNDTLTRTKGAHEGGTGSEITILWACLGIVYWLHYLTFYYCTGLASSVASGVNKAAQATLVFVTTDLFFCRKNDFNDKTGPLRCVLPMHIATSTDAPSLRNLATPRVLNFVSAPLRWAY